MEAVFGDWLHHPAVQGGLAPFAIGLLVTLALDRPKLAGLAGLAAFLTAVALVVGFDFSPLTAARKIVLAGLVAGLAGVVIDLTLAPGRALGVGAGVAAGAVALWVFLPVLQQQPPGQAWLLGGTAVALPAWLAGYSIEALAREPIRAASAVLVMGLGVGVAALIGASLSFGQYGMALGAGAGAFLLPAMLRGRATPAGATLLLPAALLVGLLGAGAAILSQLPSYALWPLALAPLAVQVPGPERQAVWIQAVVWSACGAVPAAAAILLGWYDPFG